MIAFSQAPLAPTPLETVAILVAACLAGLLTSLTPDIYPLIPVTVRTLGRDVFRRSAWVLLYAAGAATTLVAIGTGLGTLGALVAWQTSGDGNAPLNGLLAFVCLMMGAATLGVVRLRLPSKMAAWVSQAGGQKPLGMLARGLVSPLLAAWMTPTLVVLGILVVRLGGAAFGAAMFAACAAGLGVPWLILALWAGRAAPGGVWMDVVRVVLAAAMAMVGLFFVLQSLPAVTQPVAAMSTLQAWGWGAALLTAGAGGGVLMLTSRRFAQAPALRGGATGLLSLGLGLVFFGGGEVPLARAPDIVWESQHDSGLTRALMEHKPAIIDFTADWCQACKQLERDTYIDPQVRRAALRFVMVKVDCTAMDAPIKALFERYAIEGLPTVVFVNAQGQVMPTPRLTGFVGAPRFLQLLAEVR